MRQILLTERVYTLTPGSKQGNRHVHLPPGVPYERQQTAILDFSRGILSLSDKETASLAQAIRQELKQREAV